MEVGARRVVMANIRTASALRQFGYFDSFISYHHPPFRFT